MPKVRELLREVLLDVANGVNSEQYTPPKATMTSGTSLSVVTQHAADEKAACCDWAHIFIRQGCVRLKSGHREVEAAGVLLW